jgi:putative glutamine amidotransferase
MPTASPLIGCTSYRKTVVDNPSFDVYCLMPSYTEAVSAAGGIPVMIPLGLAESELRALVQRLDGLLLPGGGDINPACYGEQENGTMWGIDEERDRTEIFLVREAVASQTPLLAICRGCQIFNVALGGTLWGDIATQKDGAIRHDYFRTHPRNFLSHTVEIMPHSRLHHYLGQTSSWVNSLHHQGVRRLATDLTATAVAPDGLIEAVEISDHAFAIGVQWHPECLVADDAKMRSLFSGLVEAATARC